jgi:hypothetical protein
MKNLSEYTVYLLKFKPSTTRQRIQSLASTPAYDDIVVLRNSGKNAGFPAQKKSHVRI